MLNKLTAGLIAAALLTAPVAGSLASANPAAAATPIVKTKIVKMHRNHLRGFRIVQCYMTGGQARQVKLHAGHRFQRVACYLPTQAKLHIRNGARHVVKQVKLVKQAKQIKPAKPGHAG